MKRNFLPPPQALNDVPQRVAPSGASGPGVVTLQISSTRTNGALPLMSSLIFSISGICAYLTTLYPAFISILSRSSSLSFLLSWLRSSSSMIATTSHALSQITKSAILRSKVFRIPLLFAFSRAPMDTCAKMLCAGSASLSFSSIACSRSLIKFFRLGFPPFCPGSSESRSVFRNFHPVAASAAISKMIVNTASCHIVFFPGKRLGLPFSFSPVLPGHVSLSISATAVQASGAL